MLTVEHFQLQERSPLAYAAARLITTEIFHNRQSVEDYMSHAGEFTCYGLLAKKDTLLGAATVLHRQELTYGIFTTELKTLAISNKGEGYGKFLLGHIATQAASYGDDFIELIPVETSAEFYTKYGFQPAEEDLLTIAPTDLLANLSASER